MNVLVLEDRPEFLAKLAEAILDPAWNGKVHATMTTSVVMAAVLLLKGNWDLAFFDHDLPDGSGWEVLNAFRNEKQNNVDFPVHGVSALPLHNQRLVEHGAIGFVAKMEGEAFVPKIRQIVQSRLLELRE